MNVIPWLGARDDSLLAGAGACDERQPWLAVPSSITDIKEKSPALALTSLAQRTPEVMPVLTPPPAPAERSRPPARASSGLVRIVHGREAESCATPRQVGRAAEQPRIEVTGLRQGDPQRFAQKRQRDCRCVIGRFAWPLAPTTL